MRFIWRQRVLRAVVLMVLLTNLLEAPFPVVTAVFAREAYGSASDLGLMFGVFGGGALVGALVYSAIGHRLPRRRTFLWCFTGVPLAYLALATTPPLPLALVALGFAGVVAGPINPLLFTVTTEIVPSQLRGRVFGAARGGAWAAIPLGTLLGGVLVGAIGVAASFLAIGVLLALVVAYGFRQPRIPRDGSMNAVILVEGVSDQLALEALAARRGRDLEAEGVSLVPIGGAHAVGPYLERYRAATARSRSRARVCNVRSRRLTRGTPARA